MSLVHKTWRYATITGAFLVMWLSSASSSTGQFSVTTYVCQTPTFWCAFNGPSGVRNGTSCYCGTVWGPVGGYSIDPSGVSNAPQLPKPQQQPAPGRPPQTQNNPGEVGADDCYKGLGNCAGSFVKTSGGTSSGRAATSGSVSDTALQRLIDDATDDFSSVKGTRDSEGRSTDKYKVTVTPKGLDFCTLFIPSSTRRTPWVSCFAPDEMSYSRLVRLVSDALGNGGSRDSDGQKWTVGEVEVTVDGDPPLSVDIQRAKYGLRLPTYPKSLRRSVSGLLPFGSRVQKQLIPGPRDRPSV